MKHARTEERITSVHAVYPLIDIMKTLCVDVLSESNTWSLQQTMQAAGLSLPQVRLRRRLYLSIRTL